MFLRTLILDQYSMYTLQSALRLNQWNVNEFARLHIGIVLYTYIFAVGSWNARRCIFVFLTFDWSLWARWIVYYISSSWFGAFQITMSFVVVVLCYYGCTRTNSRKYQPSILVWNLISIWRDLLGHLWHLMQLHAIIVDRSTAKIILRIIAGIQLCQKSLENILWWWKISRIEIHWMFRCLCEMVASKWAIMKTCRM